MSSATLVFTPVSTKEAGFVVSGDRRAVEKEVMPRHAADAVHGKEVFGLYTFALSQLGALCGVPLAVIVAIAVVARIVYVLLSRRD